LNPLDPFARWRRQEPKAAKLYGAIVAQARLPVFYQELGVPDTLEGRFLLLSLHLFAVLHRLNQDAPATQDLAQELTDRFIADMETVLREVGVGDLGIPKKMRGLAASSAGLMHAFEDALAAGDEATAAVIAEAMPLDQRLSPAVSRRLAHYLREMIRVLASQDGAAICAGEIAFSRIIPGPELGDDRHDQRN
jgi:cytochrome b pre-mRNA-processing protein 3